MPHGARRMWVRKRTRVGGDVVAVSHRQIFLSVIAGYSARTGGKPTDAPCSVAVNGAGAGFHVATLAGW